MKVALIYNQDEPNWMSSRSIRRGLMEAYRHTHLDCQPIAVGEDPLVDALRLQRSGCRRLVFLESNPSPLDILRELGPWLDDVELYFHLYGDFSLFTADWQKIFEILRGRRARLFLASRAQRGLVAEFFVAPPIDSLLVCPFPIDAKIYHRAGDRRAERKRLGLAEDETVFIYSGRISVQKGFPLLLEWLARFSRERRWTRFKLLLAGTFDDLGTPLWSEPYPTGFAYRVFTETINQHGSLLRDRVIWVGQKSAADLNALYGASDIFVSLSTHHDEDFGMAPVEALFAGCRALLTRWGGYGSFQLSPGDVAFCPVKIERNGVMMDYADFRDGLTRLFKHGCTEDDLKRQARSERYRQQFSIESVATHLEKSIRLAIPAFPVTNSFMAEHVKRFDGFFKGKIPYKAASKEDPAYYRLYRHYASGR